MTSAISWYVGERLPTARALWNEKVEIRVAKTTTTLAQLKAMKMVGLENIASREIEDLRNIEIEYSIKARVLACMVNMTGMFLFSLQSCHETNWTQLAFAKS